MKADVLCSSSDNLNGGTASSSILQPSTRTMSGLDGRHYFGPQGQGWQSRDNEARTLGAVQKGREAGEPTPLLRHKNKTFMVFKPMHLWVFCQRQLKLILNIMTINGKKNVAPSSI